MGRLIDKFVSRYEVDAYKVTTFIQNMLFKAKCQNFGHVLEETKNDQVRCVFCGRVYYKVPGEER